MIYFTDTNKNILEKQIKTNYKNLIIVTSVFVVLTTLTLILINVLTETFSLILEIIFSTIYFSYLLIFIQTLNNNKNILNLHNSMLKKEVSLKCTIKEILGTQTINKLLFKKILINVESTEKLVYLYDEIPLTFKEGDGVELVICKNLIKGWLDE